MSEATVGPGTVLAGKYRLVEELGSGGMGAVWRARQVAIDREVAVKVMHPWVASAPGASERFRREAAALARLRHEAAVVMYDFGDWEGTLYIAMEMLAGRSLLDLHDRGWPLPFERVVRLCAQALELLQEAHARGMVHRDLKPANLFVTSPGPQEKVKVLDFGLALLQHDPGLQRLTQADIAQGTPEYMSPEQCAARDLDGRSDLYGMGCVLYEMFANRPPFSLGSNMETMTAHVYRDPLPCARVRAEAGGGLAPLPPALDAVIMRALAKRPDDRFPDADAMRAALLLSLQPEAAAAPRAPPPKRDRSREARPAPAAGPTSGVVGLVEPGGRGTDASGVGPALRASGLIVVPVGPDDEEARPAVIVVAPADGAGSLLAAKKLAANAEGPPVLLCGPEDDWVLMTRAIEAGVHDYVSMPLDGAELGRKVARALRCRR